MSQPKLYQAVTPFVFAHSGSLPTFTVVVPRFHLGNHANKEFNGMSAEEYISLVVENRNIALSSVLQANIGSLDFVDVVDFTQGRIGSVTSPDGQSCDVVASHALFNVVMHTDRTHLHLGLIPAPSVLEYIHALEAQATPDRLLFWQELLTTDWDEEHDLLKHLEDTFERVEALRNYPEHIALQEEGFTCAQYDADRYTITMIYHCVEMFGCLPKDLENECSKAIEKATPLLLGSTCDLDGPIYSFQDNNPASLKVFVSCEQTNELKQTYQSLQCPSVHKAKAVTEDFSYSL